MIVFKEVSIRNFLSYGNTPTAWPLDRHASTLIVGKNGNGKSCLLDAICFGLFGKPYRNINKPQLINSINGNHCVVEIDFRVNGVDYKIKRGMRPNILDVYKAGKLVDQEAAMRDMQAFIEQQILRLNFKTFKQVVILGSAAYTPFMQLSPYHRREVVEDVLDIAIFSKMNTVLKDRVASTKEEFRIIDVKIDAAKRETVSQKRIIKIIEENKLNRISELQVEVDKLEATKNEELKKIESTKQKLKALPISETTVIQGKVDALDTEVENKNSEIKQLKKRLEQFAHLKTCPTCMQEVLKKHIDQIEDATNEQIGWINTQLGVLATARITLITSLVEAQKIDAKKIQLQAVAHEATRAIEEIEEKIADKLESIEKIKGDSGNLEEEQKRLKNVAASALQLITRKNELSDEKSVQEISSVLLKDTGIKTAIIKEYLPVLNKLINKYLTFFEFFVNFNLDESFNEVIKSRGRDEFSYASFSEGEKKRIDLAILLAFRQVAAMKNSAKVNLLIFDEIQDGALDLEARGKFNELIGTMTGSNVFVISHTNASPDAYDAVIKIEKKGDFSQYEYV